MREFSADYLEHTRRGMWEETAALAPLALDSRERVLDAGCGTGELTRVLARETPGSVVGADADTDLLAVAREQTGLPMVGADATRLPFPDDSFDLVVCQALLINLPDPAAAVAEFARVSSDLVAAVEPNNAAVEVDSTVDAEERLEARVREAYLAGVETDVALGDRVETLFEDAGLSVVADPVYRHEKLVEPPYSEASMADAARKASGAGLADHETEIRNAVGEEYDEIRAEWRAMGREAAAEMADGEYRRREVVPFEVTVGRV
ncbi:MAG: class I SAM-dependent methyltransferase [Halolamina sp.]